MKVLRKICIMERTDFLSSVEEKDERLEALKQLYPEIFSDGKINLDAFKEVTGTSELPEGEDKTPGYYGLYWPGKNAAKQLAKKTATGTLEPVPGDGINEDTTHNIYIEGDNLEVLRILRTSYRGRVKMIYIDPPYNTGNDFIYPDNFKEPVHEYLKITGQIDEMGKKLVANPKSSGAFHRSWLNMMYPRLSIARELLSEDGVIFISIDDNEQANLKLLCDDVFGEENFIGLMTIMSNPRGSQNSKNLPYIHEYIFVYSKNAEEIEIKGVSKSDESLDEFKEIDSDGRKYRLLGLRKRGGAWRKEDRPNMYYPIYVNPQDGTCSLIKDDRYTVEVTPRKPNGELSRWTWGREKFETENRDLKGKIVNEGKENEGWDIFRKDYIDDVDGNEKTTKLKTIWVEKQINYQNAKNEMQELFGNSEIFDYPKPTYIVEHLSSILYFEPGDIIMDFFSGSSSSAQAVMQFNMNNHKQCKYIMVQLPVNLDKSLETAKGEGKKSIERSIKFLDSINKTHTICELGKERIRRAGKYLSESSNTKTDIGFKVYRLSESNFIKYKTVHGQTKEALDEVFASLDAMVDPLIDGWKPENVLEEIKLRQGFALDCLVEEVKEISSNKVWHLIDPDRPITIYVCLDETLDPKTVDSLNIGKDDRFICLNSAIDDTTYARLADKNRIQTL